MAEAQENQGTLEDVENPKHPVILENVGDEDEEEAETREPPPSYDTVAQKNNFFPETEKKDEDGTESKKKTKKEKKKLMNLGKNKKPFKISFYRLFAFASPLDLLLIFVGVIAAIGCGTCVPIMTVRFGAILQMLVDNEICKQHNITMPETIPPKDPSEDWDDEPEDDSELTTLNPFVDYETLPPGIMETCLNTGLMDEIKKFAKKMGSIGITIWVGSYVFVTCLNYAAERQVFRIRMEFLKAILRQDMSWYDMKTTSDFATRMTEDLNKLQEGIGEKIGMLCFFLSTFLLSIVTAFNKGWELTIILLSMIPMMGLSSGFLTRIQSSFAEKELSAYGKAGAFTEEVLSSIRTVIAFGGQDKEVERYTTLLKPAKRSGILRNALTGASGGVTFVIMYAVYGVGFWYGVKLICDETERLRSPECIESKDCVAKYTPENLVVVFFSVLMGGFQIGQSAPYAEAVATARSAASTIYSVIQRRPDIDSLSEKGMKPITVDNNITVQNLSFSYPSRKTVRVLSDLSFNVKKGQTVALVGPSGCGKSTVLQLIQRFYDPESGFIELDGKNVKSLNVGWMRDRIGVVGQEPILFDLTILENIRVGRTEVTQDEVVKAAKEANAFDFIMKLPKRFDTYVGERGAQLSGGQKQRIAIARALVRNPSILLLDEATSALDSESEGYVQAALEKARSGRTTIIVAQRLSTIRNADKIVVMKDGRVEEEGNHGELMEKTGLYHNLITKQNKRGSNESDNDLVLESLTEIPEDVPPTKELNEDPENHGQGSQTSTLSEPVLPDDVIREIAEQDPEESPNCSFFKVFKMNLKEWPFIFIGVVASIVMGSVGPIFALLFGDVLKILSWDDIEAARGKSFEYSMKFLLLGLVSGAAMFLQGLMLGISGENLTMRLRKKAFKSMVEQEIGWFDEQRNSTGALCSRLSNDASKVQGATGARIGSMLQGIAGLSIAMVIGIYYSLLLGLVTAAFFPLLIGAAFLHMKIIMGVDTVETKAFERSSKLAVDAIGNIRTVASTRSEESFLLMFMMELREPHNLTLNKAHIRGFIFGFSQAIQFLSWGACILVGGFLINKGEMTFDEVFKVANATIGGAGMIGYSFAFTADFQKAISAASRMIYMFERKSKVDANPTAGLKLVDEIGNISMKDAEFSYPTRPNGKVLNKLILSIKLGEKVALVGQSGCGKSTVIQLIQRLYDLDQGDLKVENENISGLNVPWLRSKLGLVSQEPVLFDRTIAENIQYGDNSREVSMEEVMEAARQANIHSFVSALPQGYETRVGERGTQISGGQKQRIAIARALVRKPKILLLDEATSALDSENEQAVQEALDTAMVGRTSITVSHRLTSIQTQDMIYVIDKGEVVECGKHTELLEHRGIYHKMWHTNLMIT